MKAQATTAVLALLLSAGAWAQNQDPRGQDPYGNAATQQQTTDPHHMDKNKSKQKKSTKRNNMDDTDRSTDRNSSGSSGTSGSSGSGTAGSSGTSGTSGTSGSSGTTGTTGSGERRSDVDPMTPASRPTDNRSPQPPSTTGTPTTR
jgi:uncharacterized membrane protein YgcG